MDKPQYILTDEMATIVEAVKTALELSELNYQYGFVNELNETLKQYETDPTKFYKKFPLVWVEEPYDTVRGNAAWYGTVNPNIYIINSTDKTWKASERMENNYKPVLLPIYMELLEQIVISPVFSEQAAELIEHKVTNGYYWGEDQKSVLNDAVDCIKIGSLKLRINKKTNCTPFKNF